MKKNFKSTDFFNEFGLLLILQKTTRYWKVTKSGSLIKVNGPEDIDGPILSFHEDDYRMYFQEVPSSKVQKERFLGEFGAKVRTIRPKGKNYVYATPTVRLNDYSHFIFPGVSFLDKILEKKEIDLFENRIIAIEFKDQGDSPDLQSVLILFCITADGNISAPEIGYDVDDRRMVIREFAKMNNAKADKVTLFNGEPFFECEWGQPYPREDDFYGVPFGTIKMASIGVLSAMLLSSLASSGYFYYQTQQYKKESISLDAQVNNVKESKKQFLISNVDAIANAHGLTSKEIFEISEKIAGYDLPYVRLIDVDAKMGKTIFKIEVNPFYYGYAKNFNIQLEYEKLADYLNKEVKFGDQQLNKLSISTSGDGIYEVKYEIQTNVVDINSLVSGQ